MSAAKPPRRTVKIRRVAKPEEPKMPAPVPSVKERRIFIELDAELPRDQYPNLNTFAKENPRDFVIDDRVGLPRKTLVKIGALVQELCRVRGTRSRYLWPNK